MKPFDLEAAQRGEPVVTRDGRDVKFGAYNPDASEGAIVGWVGGVACIWDKNGCYSSPSQPSRRDLFMKPKKMERWLVINSNSYGYPIPDTAFYHSKDYAEIDANGKPVARVTWEE